MKIKFSEFSSWCEKDETLENLTPDFVPSREDIDLLYSYTQKIRDFDIENVQQETGRPLKSETSILKFIKRGAKGTPYITERNFFRYLVYISETAEIPEDDPEGQERLNYLNRYLREHLVIT